MDMRERSISASQIKKFRRCAEQFRFRYHSDVEVEDDGSPYADVGQAVHVAIERYLQVGGGSPAVATTFYTEEFDKRFDGRDNKFWKRGVKCMDTFESFAEKFDDEVWGVERRVKFDFHEAFDGLNATAIMDVTTDQRVIDWKTGNRDPVEEAIQGALYALAYKAAYGEYPDEVLFVYLKNEEKSALTGDEDSMDVLTKWIRTLLQAEESEEFPANPGDSCYWCAYEEICDYAPAGWTNVDWDSLNARFPQL